MARAPRSATAAAAATATAAAVALLAAAAASAPTPAAAAAPAFFLPVYVDVGGRGDATPYGAATAAGVTWSGGAAATWSFRSPRPVAGAEALGVPAEVFQTHLSTAAGAWDVAIPVSAAEGDRRVRLRLLFAEVYRGTFRAGARTFDVAAVGGGLGGANAFEGVGGVRWTPVDVFAAVGPDAAVAVDLNVTVPSGDGGGVHLRLRRGTQNVMLSGVALTLTAVDPPPSAGAAATPGWTTVVPAAGSPAARHESCFVNYRNRLVQIGGRGARPVSLYNPASATWTSVWPPRGPGEIHHMQCVVVPGENRVTIVGAFTGPYPTESTVPHVWYYYPPALGASGTGWWLRGAVIPPAVRRGAGGVAVSPDRKFLYLVAGNVGGHGPGSTSVARTDALNVATGTWTRLPDAPHARDHVHVAVVDGQLVVAGGRNGGVARFWNANLKQVDVFSLVDGAWRTLRGGLTIARAGASVAELDDGRLLVAGGEGGGRAWATTEVLDVVNERFELVAGGALHRARHGTQAAECGGGVYVAGGSGNQGGGPELTSMEVWTPDGGGVPPRPCVPY